MFCRLAVFIALLVTLPTRTVFSNPPKIDSPEVVDSPETAKSPETNAERLAWWQDAKFGMFIHWGVYSQAGGEWNGTTDHHEWLQLTAKIPLAEYKEFSRTFNPVKFDANQWVAIAKQAGMKYLVVTAKHHDGFAMFDSPSNKHNIVQGTTYGRDPLKALAAACHEQDVRFCVYYSLGRDWEDPDVPTGWGDRLGWRSNLIDFPDEENKDFQKYFDRKVKPQVRELLTQYGPIGVMWFDTFEQIKPHQSKELIAMIRELQPNCIINDRVGRGLGDYKTAEQEIPSDSSSVPWETCMTINGHWGYNKADEKWKRTDQLLRNLIDVVSKGGNYLLNVGPTGEGVIPAPSIERLDEMGSWLRVNGEAIYGCGMTPFGEEIGSFREPKGNKRDKPKFITKWQWRATTKPGKIYVHLFEWPQGVLRLPAVEKSVTKAYLLADPSKTALAFEQSAAGVAITLPATPTDIIASVVCLELE
ncbi:alpha-L-fucosidase [Adhaeretor mobilis]|uniref:alpha-L-fucosidase n=1 Tax=Adhaeretor mobilis TaxID=1930276 RepID=A0A517MY13_9BACT|nr:alpha-L-fucosidase [Adhaeretor mobilis]QDS99756.1 Alpha-L-fucosidase [Adhaeretor mobilis]